MGNVKVPDTGVFKLAFSCMMVNIGCLQFTQTTRVEILCINIKTESTWKLSNFNFQWTETLYQNNLKNIAFFFLRAKDVVTHL